MKSQEALRNSRFLEKKNCNTLLVIFSWGPVSCHKVETIRLEMCSYMYIGLMVAGFLILCSLLYDYQSLVLPSSLSLMEGLVT